MDKVHQRFVMVLIALGLCILVACRQAGTRVAPSADDKRAEATPASRSGFEVVITPDPSGATVPASVDEPGGHTGATIVPEGNPPATIESSPPDLKELVLPDLAAVELADGPLRVVATTSIIGDIVTQVGGEAIQLTTLLEPGQDPHSYESNPQALAAAAAAHVIFVNGWDLEEGLVRDLDESSGDVPIVPVSAYIEPLPLSGAGERSLAADPHVWFSIDNVEQWVSNVEDVLSDLDPAREEFYASNAEAYADELDVLGEYLEDVVEAIPAERRILVTNHDSLGYFARDYGFEVLGAVIPGSSTFAEPSAIELAGLIEAMEGHGVCAIFSETTVNDALAQTVAAELAGCDVVQVLPLYTGALGPPGSGAESYIGLMRTNLALLSEGLR